MIKRRVLLVEDDVVVRDSLERAMIQEDFLVVSAANASDALSQVSQTPIDIAVVDLNLGPDDGWKVLERLVALQPRLPVIVMTAETGRLAHPRARDARACLPKPLDLPVFFQTLREHCTTT